MCLLREGASPDCQRGPWRVGDKRSRTEALRVNLEAGRGALPHSLDARGRFMA